MSVYTEAASKIERIENNSQVRVWNSALTFSDYTLLFQNNKDKLRIALGKHDCTFTSEYRHWIWKFYFENHECFILSGNRGTSIEVPFGMSGKKRVEFLNLFIDILIRPCHYRQAFGYEEASRKSRGFAFCSK